MPWIIASILGFLIPIFTQFSQRQVLRLLRNIRNGRVNIVVLQGVDLKPSQFSFGESTATLESEVNITVRNENFWTRLLWNQDTGFAESFMLGEVECDDLVGLFKIYIANRNELQFLTPLVFRALKWVILPVYKLFFKQENNVPVALQNVVAHYDISNEHFSSFLSPDMSYSCPIWTPTDLAQSFNETLETAQLRKIQSVIDQAYIQPSDHVLDIGGGWGALAIEAAKQTGCRVTVVTLSINQKEWAEERIRLEGLTNKIDYILCDYRQIPSVPGGYDKIISIEMLEHVGRQYLPDFFSKINEFLKLEGGRIVIQGITVINERHDHPSNTSRFVGRYIFPGAYLPSVNMLLDCLHTGSRGSLEVEHVSSIGPHYVKALRLWREEFIAAFAQGKQAKYNDTGVEFTSADLEAFRRKWQYYFCYCEALFRTGILGTHTITAVRQPNLEQFRNVPLY